MDESPAAMIDVILQKGRERSVLRRHPWVMSGAVRELRGLAGEPEGGQGAWVRVLDAGGETVGFGHYSPHSTIRVRMLSIGPKPCDEGRVSELIQAAIARRGEIEADADTDALRLVNAEGDGLPGLVVDRYADALVVRATSAGMARLRRQVADVLRETTGAAAGYERSDQHAVRREGLPVVEGSLWGDAPSAPIAIRERNRRYLVDVVAGQKTGFYLDQRDARDLVATLARGRRTLDLFSYTGGFTVAAALAGAKSVKSIDSSRTAIDRVAQNLEANGLAEGVERVRADGFQALRDAAVDGQRFDLLLLDPPPLARRKADVSKATRAYKDMLLHGFKAAAPDAHVLAWSCSHHVDADALRKVAYGAASDARREVRVLGHLDAPPDHPVSLHHPEGQYLSGWHLQMGSGGAED